MTIRRTPPCFVRPAVLAVAAACAVAGPAAADPPTRDYPPTYSSRKTAWYDIGEWFKSMPSEPPAHEPTRTEARPAASGEPESAPAWKWYGYGAPTPGRNPYAPGGAYPVVPADWHTASGATPGAIPMARLEPLRPMPADGGPPLHSMPLATPPKPQPVMTAGRRPILPDDLPSSPYALVRPTEVPERVGETRPPATISPPKISLTDDVTWKMAPAKLRTPKPAEDGIPAADNPDAPPAALKPPVRGDEPTIGVPTLRTPVAPPRQEAVPTGAALPNGNMDAPDLPIEPAPDIRLPSASGPVSSRTKRDGRMIARAQAPDKFVDAVRRACEPDVRLIATQKTAANTVVLRIAPRDNAAAWAARDRLAGVPELAGWRVEFEIESSRR